MEHGEYQPLNIPFWFSSDDPQNPKPADVEITYDPSSSTYFKKFYNFTLNTQSFENMLEFAIHVSAMDGQGNSHGYEGEDPYIISYHVDNDYPRVEYIPPKDNEGNPIPDTTYLNANFNHTLTFNIFDDVGDVIESRGVVFSQLSGETVPFIPEDFAVNNNAGFQLNLCVENCTGGRDVIYPDDGDWQVVVTAIDNLGNEVTASTTDAPRFNIRIDSEPPTIESEELGSRLGGNSTWTPVVNWGNLSPGSEVAVELRIGEGTWTTLQACDPDEEDCLFPYLLGQQPNVRVQLISNVFQYGDKNTFRVTASDSAFPPNRSVPGNIGFYVDNKGPEVKMSVPWVRDTTSEGSRVLGLHLTSVLIRLKMILGLNMSRFIKKVMTKLLSRRLISILITHSLCPLTLSIRAKFYCKKVLLKLDCTSLQEIYMDLKPPLHQITYLSIEKVRRCRLEVTRTHTTI